MGYEQKEKEVSGLSGWPRYELVQAKTRAMKDKWWAMKAHELQQAADMRDTKRFYDGLKTVFGPKTSGVTPLCNADGRTDSNEILQRWAEHFNNLLKRCLCNRLSLTFLLMQIFHRRISVTCQRSLSLTVSWANHPALERVLKFITRSNNHQQWVWV